MEIGGKDSLKVIYEKWWNNTKVFQITNYKKSWKKIGNPPRFRFRTNGAKKRKGDTCLDVRLEIGYTVFNYTNFNLQGN